MRRVLLAQFFTFVLLTAFAVSARAHDDVIPDLVDRVKNGVVNVSVVSPKTGNEKSGENKGPVRPNVPPGSPFENFFEQTLKKRPGQGARKDSGTSSNQGSGFIIDQGGVVVTANHVIEGGISITVSLADGTKLPATLIGKDKKTDIALLKVSAGRSLVALKFGDSSKLRVGQTVIAIGSPFGLSGSVSSGIVSGLDRNINVGPYDRFIQTDAAVNRGNAGGPLLNLDGEVIGINTVIISPSGGSDGVAFALPADLATGVIAQLNRFGETRRGWLGVSIQTVTDEIATSLGVKTATGALVAKVAADGPAKSGGMKPGDVILSFDGREVATMRDLPRIVAGTEIGKTVAVDILRDRKRRTLQVTIARLPARPGTQADRTGSASAPNTAGLLGLTVKPLSDEARKKYGIARSVEGVLIAKVEADSEGERKKLAAGHIIVEVQQNKVRTPVQFLAEIDAARKSGRKTVLLLVADKTNNVRFVALPVSDDALPPAAGRSGVFDDLKDLNTLD